MRRSLRPAFALIEVLVATSLLAIIGALLMSTFSSSLDAKEAVEATSTRYHLVRQAMSRMVDELSMAYLSKHVSTIEIRARTGFRGENDRIDFTAFGYVPRIEDQKKSDQRQLSYLVGTDERSGKKSILRREQANLDDDFEEGGREQTLLPDVVDLNFQYWDPTKEAWADKWDALGTELDRLPARIKIKLVVLMDDGQEQTFTTQTRVWMNAPLDF